MYTTRTSSYAYPSGTLSFDHTATPLILSLESKAATVPVSTKVSSSRPTTAVTVMEY